MTGTRGPKSRPVGERFWEKVDVRSVGDCWPWTGQMSPDGYGRFRLGSMVDGSRRKTTAHRVAYELLVGPIPEGHQIDHQCHNRAAMAGECDGGSGCPHRRCVNPLHLEPALLVENVMRGTSVPARNARKSHCVNGHPFDEANTYRSTAGRHCRICRREAMRRFHERRAS